MNPLDNYTNIPLKCEITRDDKTKSIYTIQVEKYGNRFNGLSIKLTEDQVRQIHYWR